MGAKKSSSVFLRGKFGVRGHGAGVTTDGMIELAAACRSCGKQGVIRMPRAEATKMGPGKYTMPCPVCGKSAAFEVPHIAVA